VSGGVTPAALAVSGGVAPAAVAVGDASRATGERA
jgi:hypothetical protein